MVRCPECSIKIKKCDNCKDSFREEDITYTTIGVLCKKCHKDSIDGEWSSLRNLVDDDGSFECPKCNTRFMYRKKYKILK